MTSGSCQTSNLQIQKRRQIYIRLPQITVNYDVGNICKPRRYVLLLTILNEVVSIFIAQFRS
jgi:hypothetical protein